MTRSCQEALMMSA